MGTSFVKRLKGLLKYFSVIMCVNWSDMKVLLIDDDPAATDMLEIMVQSYPCLVISANSGEDGLQLTRDEKPDLIILDLMMLEMDGLDTCKALRKFTQTPTLMLSALYSPAMVAKVLDSGADDYLSKPVSSSVLFAHMNSLMRRRNHRNPELLTVSANI